MKQKNLNLFGAAFAAAVLFSCTSTPREEQPAATETPKKEVVEVMELQPQVVWRSVDYPATLEAYEEVYLAPASPGRIENIHADVGDRIRRGAQLVEMDRTQLRQAEIQLENLEADFRRLDTLAKYGSIPQQQYDQLQTQLEVAASNVEFLKDNASLQAPFNGVVTGRYYEPGEMYSGVPNTQAGKAAVLALAQIDRLKAMVSMSESYYPQLKRGMETEVKVDVYPRQSFTGTIDRIHPKIDPLNRTFNVEVLISNSERLLRPGMFARLKFNLDQEEAILVPSMAVLKLQGSNDRYLFVDDNGKAKRISVTMGKRYDDKVEVFSDELKTGNRVIVTGQSRLLNGVPIEVVSR
ncbi:MAG: efflux RND transporter periplasmic adaptor subunit [Mariniphaga sp.]